MSTNILMFNLSIYAKFFIIAFLANIHVIGIQYSPHKKLEVFKNDRGLDLIKEYLIHSIAYGETGHLSSHKRDYAVSSIGALGYMQIAPIAKVHKCKNYELTNRTQNIRCALKYIDWIFENYCTSNSEVYRKYYKGTLFTCIVQSYRWGPTGFLGYKKFDHAYQRKVLSYYHKLKRHNEA